ncbi:MAG: hypothetical protein ISR95_03235 [Candidatus Marinimicrobia bacterium]|nr:hypothetical protein [Candidatus Neomarinimicrobiota bacterium]MBL7046632.1 hypothetical protein [Candidatus Neomarinimicrobiota bacterium]
MIDSNNSWIVHAIAVAGDGNVYVGGNFNTTGALALNNIARCDGSSWHSLGGN